MSRQTHRHIDTGISTGQIFSQPWMEMGPTPSPPQYKQALWPRDPLSPCSGTTKGSARLSLPISIPTPKAALTRASFPGGVVGSV